MTYHLLRSLALTLLLPLTHAASAASEAVAAPPKPICLWEASKDGRTHYLLGSVHVLRASDYPLPAAMQDAYKAAGRVVFEADITALNSPAAQARMLQLGTYPEGKTLFKQLPADVAKKLRAELNERRLPPLLFQQQRPWLVSVALPMIEFQRLGYSPEYGVDQHFDRKARADKKTRGFLETADFQLNLLAGFSEDDQLLFLEKTVDELDGSKELIEGLMGAWRGGKEAALNELMVDSMTEYPSLHKKLLLDRNAAWLPKLKKWFGEKETTLVVVGAGHLVGEGSVVDLLKKDGWTVTQSTATP